MSKPVSLTTTSYQFVELLHICHVDCHIYNSCVHNHCCTVNQLHRLYESLTLAHLSSYADMLYMVTQAIDPNGGQIDLYRSMKFIIKSNIKFMNYLLSYKSVPHMSVHRQPHIILQGSSLSVTTMLQTQSDRQWQYHNLIYNIENMPVDGLCPLGLSGQLRSLFITLVHMLMPLLSLEAFG